MNRLAAVLLVILEAHCMAGLRDQQYSNVGRVPWRVTVDAKEDPCFDIPLRYVHVTFRQRGVECVRWLSVKPETFDRMELGKSYSLVKVKALKNADPWAIEFEEPK